MKTKLAIAAVVMLAALLLFHFFVQSNSAQEARVHLVNSFDVEVHLPYAQAAPLFGPEGERAWAGADWNPQFIHPRPANDVEGAVFTLHHAHGKAVWVNTAFDLPGKHFQYVYFIADKLVTTVDVRFTPEDEENTRVHVTYARTALKADANKHVQDMAEGDKKAGPEWQAAIDKYVGRLKQNGKL